MGKPCTLCGQMRPLEQFYAAPGCRDGVANQCKECVKVRARKRRLEKLEEVRAYDRERSRLSQRVLDRAERFIRYKEAHPERRAAHVDYAGDKGMGTKVSDRFAVPMCEGHHAEQHRLGWKSFEARYNVKCLLAAETYWRAWPGRIAWERKLEEPEA